MCCFYLNLHGPAPSYTFPDPEDFLIIDVLNVVSTVMYSNYELSKEAENAILENRKLRDDYCCSYIQRVYFTFVSTIIFMYLLQINYYSSHYKIL